MRLSIELTDRQHKAIKSYAALQGTSIKDFVIEKLFNNDPVFNSTTEKTLKASEAGKELHEYSSLDSFISEMDDE